MIYLICDNVDLGYHVIKAMTDKDEAERFVKAENEKYNKSKIEDLKRGCGYSQEAAELFVLHSAPQFFVDPCVLEGETEAESLLRKIAAYLGNGGYNAPEVDVKIFEEKIFDGIRQLLAVQQSMLIAKSSSGLITGLGMNSSPSDI